MPPVRSRSNTRTGDAGSEQRTLPDSNASVGCRGVVLVTGAGGYGGSFVAQAFVAAGFSVRAGDVASAVARVARVVPGAQAVRCDVTDRASLEAACVGVDTVCHLAALVPYNLARAYSFDELWAVNVAGTRTLLDVAARAGVRHFVHCSSTGVVFGGQPISGGDESLPEATNDAYACTKAAAEQSALRASSCSGMAVVSLRPNGIVGPGEAHHTPKVLLAARLGFARFMCFAPHARTDFTHRASLAHAFLCARARLAGSPSERARVAGRAYFVTDDPVVHTLEHFAPVLVGLGFASPFAAAVLPASIAGRATSGRVSRSELRAALARAAAARVAPPTPLFDNNALVVLTAEPPLALPGWLLLPLAAMMQLAAALVSPIASVEPFLTLSDARKVIHDNHYSSAAARRDLGWAPRAPLPAESAREVVEHLLGEGFCGHVTALGWGVWASTAGGVAATGALAHDVAGVTTALVRVLSAVAAGGGWSVAPAGAASPALLRGLRAVFRGALCAHVLEAVLVFAAAWRWRMAAGEWAVQVACCGFPAVNAFLRLAGDPAPRPATAPKAPRHTRARAAAVACAAVTLFVEATAAAWYADVP